MFLNKHVMIYEMIAIQKLSQTENLSLAKKC